MVVVGLLAERVVRGDVSAAVQTGGIGALVVWAAWMLLVRPSIRVRPDRAVVVNVGRITEVPWARIVDIRRRLQLILDLDDGRSVEAWGSPFPKRGLAGRGLPGRAAAGDTADSALAVLRGAWLSGSDVHPGAPVVRRADVLALGIGAASVGAAVLGLVAGANS